MKKQRLQSAPQHPFPSHGKTIPTVTCSFGRRGRGRRIAAPLGVLTFLLVMGWVVSGKAEGDTVALKLVSSGAGQLSRLRAQELTLSPERPAAAKKVPAGLTAPLYGVLRLGPKDAATSFLVLLDAPEGKSSRLYVDSNANGDLTDDLKPEWNHKSYAGREGDQLWLSVGGVTVQVRYGKETIPLHITLSRYDTTEPSRAPQFLPLTYTSDFAREGTATLSGKPFHIWLSDGLSRGDFRGSGVAGQMGIFLLIDVNGNGKIDPRGEIYDASEPFNIAGVTYELRSLNSAGSEVEITKSSRSVAEILPPPDLSVGKTVVSFEKTATDGQTIKFPSDYKGKLVLLYFWATWCGDCAREVPIVARAYAKYHEQGVEILGISLDHPDQSALLAAYTKEHEMPWPQFYDGKVWDADIAKLYFITHTPSPFLVDGDTGVILASELDLQGDRLIPTLEKALKQHTKHR